MTKSHNIPRLRQTLITLKEHSILLALFLVVLLVDQTVSGFIELRYSSLGPSGAFWVWWTQTFFGYFVTSIVFPALCLRCAGKHQYFQPLTFDICPDFAFFKEQLERMARVSGLSRLHVSRTAND